MLTRLVLSIACFASCASTRAATLSPAPAPQSTPDAVLLRMPDVSRDHIAFRYDGDVWIVDKRGGLARALSSSEGSESFPRFSPDGKSLAFMGGYDGGSDLYVLSIDGGVPRRVTHHPDGETLCDWHPNGQELLFHSSMISGQRRAPKLFRVPATGGQPQALPVPWGTFGTIDETGTWLAYTPSSREFRTWKRYQGGLAQDIWLFNLETEESLKITDHPGTDALPMWHGRQVVFLSDRGPSGRANLWSYDTRSRRTEQLTDFEQFDVRFPSIGPEDVVFENGGKLYRYEFAGGRTVAVEVSIPSDRPKLRARTLTVDSEIAGGSLSPNTKRLAIEAHGEIFSVPVEQGVVRNLTQSDGVAERSPSWSPDGRWIAYVSDAGGEYELYVRRSDGKPFCWRGEGAELAEKRLTSIGAGWKYDPDWAPDSKSFVFATNDGGLHRVELETGELKTLDTDPNGQPLSVAWSPDSRWLAYSHEHSRTEQNALYLYDLENDRRHEVTSGLFSDSSPTFDGNGDWLYFLSSRTFQPIYSDFDTTWIYTNSTNLLAVPLRADVENPWAARSDEQEIDDDEDAQEEEEEEEGEGDEGEAEGDPSKGEGKDESKDESKDEDQVEPVEIELDGFEARAIQLPVDAGRLRGLEAAKGKVCYLRLPRTGSDGERPSLVYFDLGAKQDDDRKEHTILEGVQAFGLSAKGDKVLVVMPGSEPRWALIDLAKGQKVEKTIDLSGLETTVDPRTEWAQILTDAGRIVRDFFYEETLHGVDWPALVGRYREALSDATSRDDLHYLIGELIGELNVGHAYNYAPPTGLETAGPGRPVGLLGCDWEAADGRYRIARVIGGGAHEADARGPLQVPGVDARAGDWLLSVNGAQVDTSRDVYSYFEGTAGKPTELVLNVQPTLDGQERTVLVEPVGSERGLRYRDWVEHNRAWVEQQSGGRIGYVHVPDTGRNGQNELVRQLQGQFHRDALIVDERWNGGGQIPTRFIELLNRPVTNFWAIRNGEDWTWPPVHLDGPKAMLINGASGSGGDAFPYYFRQAGLGKLIGERTWGGLVGISGNPRFVDGSRISVPRFAFYETDGTWGVEGHGVDPDIEVVADPARMTRGQDPQLEAALEHLTRELETWQFVRPRRPASPRRAGSGITPEDH